MEATEWFGCAGVKVRQPGSLCLIGARARDEGRGTLRAGTAAQILGVRRQEIATLIPLDEQEQKASVEELTLGLYPDEPAEEFTLELNSDELDQEP